METNERVLEQIALMALNQLKYLAATPHEQVWIDMEPLETQFRALLVAAPCCDLVYLGCYPIDDPKRIRVLFQKAEIHWQKVLQGMAAYQANINSAQVEKSMSVVH